MVTAYLTLQIIAGMIQIPARPTVITTILEMPAIQLQEVRVVMTTMMIPMTVLREMMTMIRGRTMTRMEMV